MSEEKQPNPIDVHVGSRVKLRRTMLSISQEKLGDALGVTFQQVQKYEKGTNRIGASRLEAIARFLDVPVSYFFKDAPGEDGPRPGFSEDADAIEVVRVLRNPEARKPRAAVPAHAQAGNGKSNFAGKPSPAGKPKKKKFYASKPKGK